MNTKFLICALGTAALLGSAPASAQQWSVRVGIGHLAPHADSSDISGPVAFPAPGGVPAGVSLDVRAKNTLLLGLTYQLDSHWQVELSAGVPPTHDVTAKLDLSKPNTSTIAGLQGQTIAKVRQFAPTLLVNYQFGEAGDSLRPYVGVGINYTKFDETESTSAGNQLSGGATRVSLTDSIGWAAQVGALWRIDQDWSLQAGVTTADVRTTLTASAAGYDRKADIRFKPILYGIGIVRSF